MLGARSVIDPKGKLRLPSRQVTFPKAWIIGKVFWGHDTAIAMKNKLLTVLPDAERFALYGLPDFDDRQRLNSLSLSEQELALACSRPGLHVQAYCVLRAVQRCRLAVTESALQHLMVEVRRLIARGVPEPAIV